MDRRKVSGIGLVVLGGGLAVLSAAQLLAGGAAPGSPATSPARSGGSIAATASLSPRASATPGPGGPTTSPAPAGSSAPPATPTVAPNPTVGTDAEAAIRAFFAELVTAIRTGTEPSMFDRLHPAVLDRYGAAACQAKLASDQADSGYAVEILEIRPLAPWDYVTDERTTAIELAWTVEANVTALGQAARREVHVAPLNGGIGWFTDCGTPVPSP